MSPAAGQRADQLSIYEDRAAAHAIGNPDPLRQRTFELHQVQIEAGEPTCTMRPLPLESIMGMKACTTLYAAKNGAPIIS